MFLIASKSTTIREKNLAIIKDSNSHENSIILLRRGEYKRKTAINLRVMHIG